MSRRFFPALSAVPLLVVATVATVRAQAPSSETGAVGPGAAASREAGGEPRVEQMLWQAREIQTAIDRASQAITLMLREARNSGDLVRELCLDDRLNQIDVAAETARGHISRMEFGVSADDPARVRQDHAVMLALGERSQKVAADADKCLGSEGLASDETGLLVTFSPDIPTQDTVASGGAIFPVTAPQTARQQPPPPLPVSAVR